EIWAAPDAFADISKALEDAGIDCSEAAITRQPENTVEIKELSKAQQVLRLIDKLEDLDDVQSVHCNDDIADEIMEQIDAE
ncbi:MAG: YebC/PmpR family DNA-binding transcriptional regulator, partial [Lentisphaeria bacterium]|nr:YebC/PmpR family DNA-binding transcriptional regulator [Lentisphaeria bacterium]